MLQIYKRFQYLATIHLSIQFPIMLTADKKVSAFLLSLQIFLKQTSMRRKRYNEWTVTAKSWPLTTSAMSVIVTVTSLVWSGHQINWLHSFLGLPLLCLLLTWSLYTFMYPVLRRNFATNSIAHILWTFISAVATSYIATGTMVWSVLLAILPIGLITAGITHGKSKVSAYVYAFDMLFPFLYTAVLSIIGIFPLTTIITFMTVPVACACTKTMFNSLEGGPHLTKDLGARTANFLHMFSILLSVAFAIARFI